MADERTPLLAVLIDADNTSYKWAEVIFEEIASLGEASVRRIYGDFSDTRMKGWSGEQAGLGIVPHHQPANTVGKNASD
ncbi:MAG: NYN domain-containing protein, partial [Pseudomonadota bacterium]